MHHISHLLPWNDPVRQNGCVKEADGVKYFSSVARWRDGGDCVRRWMTRRISWAGGNHLVFSTKGGAPNCGFVKGKEEEDVLGSSIVK